MNGKFITLEGIEGAGKSTQLIFIEQFLSEHGKQVVMTREPGGTPLGEQIREILLTPRSEGMSSDAELLLMFAARAEHIKQVIEPTLLRGDWVISDRFVDATFAYQGGGRGIDEERIQHIANWTLKGMKPDLTFLFDLTVEQGLQRVQDRRGVVDRFEQEERLFFNNIRQTYLDIAQRQTDRVKVIDASKTIYEIQAQLTNQLSHLLET